MVRRMQVAGMMMQIAGHADMMQALDMSSLPRPLDSADVTLDRHLRAEKPSPLLQGRLGIRPVLASFRTGDGEKPPESRPKVGRFRLWGFQGFEVLLCRS